MAGLMGPILVLGLIGLTGILAIQNDRTSSKSLPDEVVLSASAFTAPEKTSDAGAQDLPLNLLRTSPTLQLESSRSVRHVENDQTHFSLKTFSSDEPIDALTSSKHVDQIDGNNIEVRPGEYFRTIAPTKSNNGSGEAQGAPQGRNRYLSGPHAHPGPFHNRRQHQQAQPSMRVNHQRQSRQGTSRIFSEHAPPPVLQTASPGQGHRQANPDIQDIITGIVKLLNGNVNVAANTVRPLRPIMATRINNRGPPRISDGPLLPPDFDTPGMNPPPPPPLDHPYPFEKPPALERPSINQLPPERPTRPYTERIPVPEQIVPQGNRPGYGGLWNRPYRPGVTRRPIPPYKPLPPQGPTLFQDNEKPAKEQNSDNDEKMPSELKPTVDPEQESPDDNKPSENSGKLPENTNPKIEEKESVTESNESSTTPAGKPNQESATKKPQKYQPPMKEDKLLPENTLILGSNPQSFPIPSYKAGNQSEKNPEEKLTPRPVDPQEEKIKPTKTVNDQKPVGETAEGNGEDDAIPPSTPETASKPMTQMTLGVETSSSVQVIEPTPTITEIQPTVISLPNSEETSNTKLTTNLEPSKVDNTELKFQSSTPTEGLPSHDKSTSPLGDSTRYPGISSTFSKSPAPSDYYPYRPRPGIVLDDTLDYTSSPGPATQRPYEPSRYPQIGDIFDVTVSAVQGPGGGGPGEGVRVSINPAGGDVILTTAVEGQGFVSIDGKRTYLNLFDNSDPTSGPTQVQPQPTRTKAPPVVGTGYAVAQPDSPVAPPRPGGPVRRPPYQRRPTQPPVRIDTCIVGDTSTCDSSQHEACATVQGVSACHCKPGFARLQHSLPCKKIVSIVVSMRVDKIYDRKVVWDEGLSDRESEQYQTLAYEANRAIESAMSMTPFSDEYMGSSVNNIYQGDISQGQGGVFVNATLKLTYEPRTSRPALAGEMQKHLLGVIHRRNNNIGKSALYVDSPPGSVSNLQDLDECASSELNDCHSSATCMNTFGSFVCTCNPGYKDAHKGDPNESGRSCLTCPTTQCNSRGTCSYQGDQMQCTCVGNYYGAQCEVDGEVLGVAIGASVAALVIIVLTLVCLVMWSRRWSREQKAVGSPVYGYMQGGMPGTLPGTLARVSSVGTLASVKQGPPTSLPPYMWAHIADHMATANLYATEPMGPTRPSSAMFGYPTMSAHGTLPPVPLPRLQAPPRPRQRHQHQPEPDSSDSELQDKDRADLIPQHGGFHVPRPKSRSSVANQSGIYYDVEYDQGDAQHLSKNNIPMSTYSMARPYYRT